MFGIEWGKLRKLRTWCALTIVVGTIGLNGCRSWTDSKSTNSEPAVPVKPAFDASTVRPVENALRQPEQPPAGKLVVRADPAHGGGMTTVAPGQPLVVRVEVANRADAPLAPQQRPGAILQTRAESDDNVVVRRAELELIVQSPAQATVGSGATFKVAIINKGTRTAYDVTLRCMLPDTLAHANGKELENSLGNLEAGTHRTLSLKVTPRQAGEMGARFVLSAREAPPIEGFARFNALPCRLSVSLVGPKTLHENEPVLYEVVATNPNAEPLRNVVIEAVLPEGIGFVRATDNGVYDQRAHRVRWNVGDIGGRQIRGLVWHGLPRKVGDAQMRTLWWADQGATGQETQNLRIMEGAATNHPR